MVGEFLVPTPVIVARGQPVRTQRARALNLIVLRRGFVAIMETMPVDPLAILVSRPETMVVHRLSGQHVGVRISVDPAAVFVFVLPARQVEKDNQSRGGMASPCLRQDT